MAYGRAPVAKEVLALLAAKAGGQRFAGPKGRLLLVTPNVLRAKAGNLFGNVFDLNDHFLYVGEPCGPAWVGQRHAEWQGLHGSGVPLGGSQSPRPPGPTDAWLTAQCGLLLSRLLSCRPTPADVAGLVAPSFAASRARSLPPHSGAGRLLNAALGPLVFDFLHPPPTPLAPLPNGTAAAETNGGGGSSGGGTSRGGRASGGEGGGGGGEGSGDGGAAAAEASQEEEAVGDIGSRRRRLAEGRARSSYAAAPEARSGEDLEVAFRGLCQRRVVVVHERLFGLYALGSGRWPFLRALLLWRPVVSACVVVVVVVCS
jgi:hypothetical protein